MHIHTQFTCLRKSAFLKLLNVKLDCQARRTRQNVEYILGSEELLQKKSTQERLKQKCSLGVYV